MLNMSLRKIADACSGTYCGSDELLDREVSCVAIDSRKISKDGLFIAMRGERTDGHRFIEQVYAAGALCAIGEEDITPPEGAAYIRVESSGQALKDAAAWYRSGLSVKVVGISGSVGKTSTKETIAAVLSKAYRVHKTAANFNNEIGLPLTIFDLKPEHEVAVLEMGINHFGEMTRLAKVAQPDICVLTNIGNCHLEFLNDRDGVLKAKTEMFAYMNPNGTVILNGDDDKLHTVRDVCGKAPVFFGLNDDCDYLAVDIKSRGLLGTDCTIRMPGTDLSVSIPIPGGHAVYNTLAACAVADTLGVPCDSIREAIAGLTAMEGRGQIVRTASYTLFNDCYNANPASMHAALDVLDYADGRKIAIVGDMLELGEQEEALHYECGQYAAGKDLSLLLAVGRLGRMMAKGAADTDSSLSVHAYDSVEELFAELPVLLSDGDTILIKASHAMGFDRIVTALQSDN